jgi:hypothetical protein
MFDQTTFELGDEAPARLAFGHIETTMVGARDRLNELVRGALGTEHSIDEMAVCFWDDIQVFHFISTAVRNGWMLFNQADDKVNTYPIQSSYEVRYWFLRKEGVPFRIEAMRIVKGHSPYHTWLEKSRSQRMNGAGRLAHASFKVATEEEYANAVHHLTRQMTLNVLQHCESTYGRFSYLNLEDGVMPPIKPRINLRDDAGGVNSGN